VVKVPSTASRIPRACASAAIPSRSATRSIGLETVSIRIIRVSGRSAAATAPASVASARLVAIPSRGSSSRIRRSERP